MKKILPIIILAALLLTAFYYLNVSDENSPESTSRQLTIYGNVDIRDVALGFRVAGRIIALNYEEGDQVNQGDLLALLDKQPYEEDVALCRAQLAEAEAALQNAERMLGRNEKLLAQKAVAQADYDDALTLRNESLARCETAKAALARALTSLADTAIYAPASGVILTRLREPGSVVGMGEPVYSLALNNPVWVRTYVGEPELGSVFPGQKAEVLTSAGRVYPAQVGFISPQAEFTPKNVETTQLRADLVYRLRVVVNQPDNGLRQGMPVTVKLFVNKP